MRKLILLFSFVLFNTVVFSQENPIIKDGNYFINNATGSSTFILNSSNTGKSAQDLDLIKNSSYSLTVTGIEDDVVYFRFWEFGNEAKNTEINGDNNILYNMPLKDFKKVTSVIYNRVDWKIGVFTVPFKLRFNDFSFESNVNIGTSIGAKIRYDRRKEKGFALEPLLGIGLSAISLNKDNSDFQETTNLSAFSFNGGFIFHITDTVNLGAILGFDYLSDVDQKKYNWVHNGNGWLGLGVNIAFGTGSENTRNAGSN
jgi:hypothetical protein